MKLLLGNDPEVWAAKDGKVVSAYGLIDGTKKNPNLIRNGMVQVDGMALEFGINPASTEEEFLYSITDVLAQLEAMIPDHQLVIEPIAEFGNDFISQQPDEATNLGCDPDFNAWGSLMNARPDGDMGFRTAAGHLHVGWTDSQAEDDSEHIFLVEEAVKQLDFYLGLPSVVFDSCTKRREMYGKAGAYRPKSYGLEYRTLSNKWITDKKLMSLVYRNTHKAFEQLGEGAALVDNYGDIQHIINNSDVDAAISIMNREGIRYEV